MSLKVIEKSVCAFVCVCALKISVVSIYRGVAVLSATNRVTHHVWVDTKTLTHDDQHTSAQ